jgi:hypothetical protein
MLISIHTDAPSAVAMQFQKISFFTSFKIVFLALISLKYTHCICELSCLNSSAMYKVLKTYTLARFEPTIFCSVGGDHYTKPPGLLGVNLDTLAQGANTCRSEFNPLVINVIPLRGIYPICRFVSRPQATTDRIASSIVSDIEQLSFHCSSK